MGIPQQEAGRSRRALHRRGCDRERQGSLPLAAQVVARIQNETQPEVAAPETGGVCPRCGHAMEGPITSTTEAEP